VDRFAQHAPVIVIGRAEANAVDRVHAFRKGCDDYVPRPFDYQELVAVISHGVDRVISALLQQFFRASRIVRFNRNYFF
jgi:DNA-binding response OmpR family regulator